MSDKKELEETIINKGEMVYKELELKDVKAQQGVYQ
jgi:hypothetical protein